MGVLDGLLGGRSRGGMSPLTMGLLGLLAYRTFKGKGRLADMLDRKPGDGGAPGTDGGSLGNMLGGLFGGSVGGGLSGGLADLLKRFQNSGQEEKANSWVSTGPNKSLSASELEQALGEERIDWLTQETGMSREELLAGLSRELPDVVDKLTPQGRLPSKEEAERMV